MLPPLAIVLILGICYSLTIAPDLTWAHFSADGGDLIAAAATGGVPHPSGYPLYLILARGFQLLPIGTLAFRTNLLSAVCTIAASLGLYAFLAHQFRTPPLDRFTALLSALAFGLAPLIWGQALVTEVYALHGLLITFFLYAMSVEKPIVPEWALGLLFGLAAANHLSSVILFPLLALDFESKTFVPARTLLKRFLGVLSGLSLYLTIPLRAYFDPPINWGDASTLDGFIWLVSGQIYHAYTFDLPLVDVIGRFRAFAGLLLEQFTWVGVLLAIYGVFTPIPRRLSIPTIWTSVSYLLFAIFYASRDSQVNLLPVWICIAIWLAYGLQDLLAWLENRPSIRVAFVALLFVGLMARIPSIFSSVDVSHDSQATDFINHALSETPPNAIVVANSDEYIFALWYAQFALGARPDMMIIAEGLLPYDWYLQSLQHAYPHGNIPLNKDGRLFHLLAANPDRTVCYVSPDEPVQCK